MLRRGMVSRIPFGNPTPIIDIPQMSIASHLLKFGSRGSMELYRKLVNQPYDSLRARITGKQIGPDSPGSVFGPRWRYIRLVSLSPLLRPVSLFQTWIPTYLWKQVANTGDDGNPNLPKLRELVNTFQTFFPEETN